MFPPFNIDTGPPAAMAPAKACPFQPLVFPANEAAGYCPADPVIGLMAPVYPILFEPSPGGAARPGGGPLAVLNVEEAPPSIAPFMPCMTPGTF